MFRKLIFSFLAWTIISSAGAAEAPSNRLIAFYYGWYGNPQTDRTYEHWNSEVMRPGPNDPKAYPGGDDIASNFYPEAGCYSVNDPATLDRQMRELASAKVGVIAASWWGKDTFTGKNLPRLLDAAQRHGIKVCIHIEPFPGRNAATTRQAITYLIDAFGKHPALYRSPERANKPLFFVYDSYLIPPAEWASIFAKDGKQTIRGTPYDSTVIGLWVKQADGQSLIQGNFDGFYTYFASNGFTYGSSTKNWKTLAAFAREHHLLFIPSVGPGYVDTRIRPWNKSTTRSRKGGRYYDEMFKAAIDSQPELISITSYNEWHEGTQIEPAVPKKIASFTYQNYSPLEPQDYLKRTGLWAERFTRVKH
jgi:glycoprotein endo-alpha-1,2-mannosidase